MPGTVPGAGGTNVLTDGAHKETVEEFDLAADHRTDRSRESLELRRPAMRMGRGIMRARTGVLGEQGKSESERH